MIKVRHLIVACIINVYMDNRTGRTLNIAQSFRAGRLVVWNLKGWFTQNEYFTSLLLPCVINRDSGHVF